MPTEKDYQDTIKELKRFIENISTSLLRFALNLGEFRRLEQQFINMLNNVKHALASVSDTHSLLFKVEKTVSNIELKKTLENIGSKLESAVDYFAKFGEGVADDITEYSKVIDSIVKDIPKKINEGKPVFKTS